MRKLLIGTALCALCAAPALADEPAKVSTEPVKLSLSQMDKLTAGGWGFINQSSWVSQTATAVAIGGHSFFSAFSSNATAVATNVNETEQEVD